jgi:hypothetical protein
MRTPKSITAKSAVVADAARPRARRTFDGVIAGYLHDISQRHRHTVTPPPRRLAGAASR